MYFNNCEYPCRLSGLQHENLNLKQQLDMAQQMASDRAGVDLQDKLNTMIASLKSDHEKVGTDSGRLL